MLHQAPDRAHGLLGQVGRGPAPAPLAEEQAHDTVVGPEVETPEAVGDPETGGDLPQLLPFQDGAAEQGQSPGLGRGVLGGR